MNIFITPNLMAAIIPGTQAAGFHLGTQLNQFKNYISLVEISESDYFAEYYPENTWCIYYQNYKSPWSWDKRVFSNIFLFWNKSVTLEFDSHTQTLTTIILGSGYKGKLFGLAGIGDKLNLLEEKYDFIFQSDFFYLLEKKDNKCEYNNKDIEIKGVEIKTNYLVPYTSENNNQIIESIGIFSR